LKISLKLISDFSRFNNVKTVTL